MDNLREISYQQLANARLNKHRSLYGQIDLTSRMIGIVGARGVGKTTLLLQLMKQKIPQGSRALYVSADNLYFQENRLFESIAHLYRYDNIDHFFIDEIHRYPHWKEELHAVYESLPTVKVVFSGNGVFSDSGVVQYTLAGLSFREYLNLNHDVDRPVIAFADLIEHPEECASSISSIPKLLGYFQDYLASGYYAYYHDNTQGYYETLHHNLDKAIYQDVPSLYPLKTQNLVNFKRILLAIATSFLGEVNVNNLAKQLRIDNKTAQSYLEILTEIGLIRNLPVSNDGQLPAKIVIDNTTLLMALNHYVGKELSLDTVRELFFIQSVANAKIPLFCSVIGNYRIAKQYFEIGGKSKESSQLHGNDNAFLVKDGVLHPSYNALPLYLFGFLY
ncbi:MAG: AAA family ATPase [Pseudomonadota bacterium]|nr:AAA family ATPase [Pseudomonadota bacterium]